MMYFLGQFSFRLQSLKVSLFCLPNIFFNLIGQQDSQIQFDSRKCKQTSVTNKDYGLKLNLSKKTLQELNLTVQQIGKPKLGQPTKTSIELHTSFSKKSSRHILLVTAVNVDCRCTLRPSQAKPGQAKPSPSFFFFIMKRPLTRLDQKGCWHRVSSCAAVNEVCQMRVEHLPKNSGIQEPLNETTHIAK